MPPVRRGTQKMHISLHIQQESAELATAALEHDCCEDSARVSEAIRKLGNPRSH